MISFPVAPNRGNDDIEHRLLRSRLHLPRPLSSSPHSAIQRIRPGDDHITVEFDSHRRHTFTQLPCAYSPKLLSTRSKEDSVAIVYVLSYGGSLTGGVEVELEVVVGETASLMSLSQVRSSSCLWSGQDFALFKDRFTARSHIQRRAVPPSLVLARPKIIKAGNLSTHDCTSLKRCYFLPPPGPGNLLQTHIIQPTPDLPSRIWRVTHVLDSLTSGQKSPGEE